MPLDRGPVHIVGAGPTGTLLAILMQRRGLQVTLYDGRADPRGQPGESGRSINLALADRGIHALAAAGVADDIVAGMVPMRGRRVHQQDGAELLLPYGQRPNEVIYSISRHDLNQALLGVAGRLDGVEMKFDHRLRDFDFAAGTAHFEHIGAGHTSTVTAQPLIAAEGAGSATRRHMAATGLIVTREVDLDHGYKELSMPAGPHGAYPMAADALHIWPRGDFMLIALPNADHSFTATLFLARRGTPSFEALGTPAAVERFFDSYFPDARALMPDCAAEFCAHPVGLLGTVYADRWHVGGSASLIGDAAHAIVPFHGQGMNCCFEDCLEFDACVARNATWESVFEDFFAARKPNTDAIAAMALENYLEMRARVVDPGFRLQQQLALELERRYPQRFIPRYGMVMFHHEIPYAAAWQRGQVQSRLLNDLTAGATTIADIDYARAEREINRTLPELAPRAPA